MPLNYTPTAMAMARQRLPAESATVRVRGEMSLPQRQNRCQKKRFTRAGVIRSVYCCVSNQSTYQRAAWRERNTRRFLTETFFVTNAAM
jgi:hypothetical protein